MGQGRVAISIALLTIFFCMLGCGQQRTGLSKAQQPSAPPALAGGVFTLPTPAALLSSMNQPRGVSAAMLMRTGSDYVPGMAQRTTGHSDSSVSFSPAWSSASDDFDTVAYAIYNFNLEGVTESDTVKCHWWGTWIGYYESVWIGLSRWDEGRWEWYAGPESGTLELGALGSMPYAEPGTGDLFVAVVLVGTAEVYLQQVELNGKLPPEASLTADPLAGLAPLSVNFDASASMDPFGSIAKYEWDWDGTGSGPWDFNSGMTATASHLYFAPGTYEAWVRVTDGDGATDTASIELTATAENQPPAAALTADPLNGDVPLDVDFDASDSTDADGTIMKYEWDWDGAGAGPWDFDSGATSSVLHQYPDTGTYQAWVRVTDDDGATDTASVDVTVTNAQGDWWMFGRESTHNRLSPYIGAQTNNAKWSLLTGDAVYSSPAIGADGTVYIGSHDQQLRAVNQDGTLKWAFATGGRVYSSPAIGVDGTVYIGSDDGYLYALTDAADHAIQKWSYLTGGNVRSCPALDTAGVVYIRSEDHSLYAINPDGTQKWAYPTGSGGDSSPAIGTNGMVYVGCNDGKLYAINPDGTFNWAFTTGDMVTSSPAIDSDGTIYVGSYDKKLYAINADSTLKWSYTTGGLVPSSPAIDDDGTVYVGSSDGSLYAINSDSTLKWSFPTGSVAWTSSPAVDADSTVYVGSWDNKIYAINFDGSLKWSYPTGDTVRSSPAVAADGTVYVGSHDGKLYAFGPGAG